MNLIFSLRRTSNIQKIRYYKRKETIQKLYNDWNNNAIKVYKYKEIEWKIVRGHYSIEKEYRLSGAWNEIKKKLNEWCLTNNNDKFDKKTNENINEENKITCTSKQETADLIWESVDEYLRSYNTISKLFQCIYEKKNNGNND
jgi:hypothetical protein